MNSPESCSPLTPLEPSTNPIKTPKLALRIGLSFVRQHWQRLIHPLAHANPFHAWRPNELHMRQRVDRDGRVYWQAYDPVSGRSTTGSEADIRAWIEQLHYVKR